MEIKQYKRPNMAGKAFESLLEETDRIEEQLEGGNDKAGCFVVKPAKKWIEEAKLRPIPKMLFSEFWFQNELCILFADTNVGKSILAVQMADSISRGAPIAGFKIETGAKKVAYFDFELSDKQLEKRYSANYTNHYDFDDKLFRVEIDMEAEVPKKHNCFEDYLCDSFEKVIEQVGVEVIIIDNITYLKNDNERAKDALLLMKHLKAINKKYGVSILVLAHTPKRDATKPLTKNDLAGSKMLMNFCDSAFAIGESASSPSMRYLKQIKQRNTEQVYHSENVAVFKIVNPHNFLKFQFEYFDSEQEHLRQLSLSDLSQRDSIVQQLKNEGLANTQIAEQLGVSEGTVRNTLKKIAA